jgi:Co/Zn/Cd efflux system component
MIWRFRGLGIHSRRGRKDGGKAAKLVAYTFLYWASMFSMSPGRNLSRGSARAEHPRDHNSGRSLVVMQVLFFMKYRIGKSIGSRSLVADSKQTLVCCYLSVALLAGLGLNYLFGIWWADPAAGMVIVVFLMREGYEVLREGKAGCCGT